MKLFLKIIISVAIIFVLGAGGAMFYLSRGLEAGVSLDIGSIEPSSLEDGTYLGKYTGGRWTNELEITLKDHRIRTVKIKKDVTFSKPEVSKELFDRVVEKQTVDVDAVSGATVTCRAYLKAIENALAR